MIDFMPPRGEAPDLVRIVEGVARQRADAVGARRSASTTATSSRGSRARRRRRALAVAGPGRARASARRRTTRGEDMRTISEFTVAEGERVPFVLTWFPSHEDAAGADRSGAARSPRPRAFWREWNDGAARSTSGRLARGSSARSLIVLKALTYAPTGGIVAAPTTSLPEWIGGVRNWDYRYCWLRDATLTLLALLNAGYVDEARALARLAAARGRRRPGRPPDHVRRRRRAAAERVRAAVAAGYEGSRAGAGRQRGERAAAARRLRRGDGRALPGARRTACRSSSRRGRSSRSCSTISRRRGGSRTTASGRSAASARHFVHSKVMAWVAFDRAVRTRRDARTSTGRSTAGARMRDEIHAEVCAQASTRSSARSRSRTARRSSTRACC